MKIAIPAEEKNLDSNVCPSFGRTSYFLIYNIDTDESVFLDNSAAESQGGAGIKAAQIIVDNSVKVLLTPRCGENAAEVFKKAGISIFKTNQGTVNQNVEAYKLNLLSALNEFHKGFHGHGQ